MLETYGFAIYIAAFTLSAAWFCWSFIPDEILSYIGIIYYPSKYQIIFFICFCAYLLDIGPQRYPQ